MESVDIHFKVARYIHCICNDCLLTSLKEKRHFIKLAEHLASIGIQIADDSVLTEKLYKAIKNELNNPVSLYVKSLDYVSLNSLNISKLPKRLQCEVREFSFPSQETIRCFLDYLSNHIDQTLKIGVEHPFWISWEAIY